MNLLKNIKKDSSTTSVVLITHRTNELIHEQMATIESILPRQQVTYMFLSEHTEKRGFEEINSYDGNMEILADKYKIIKIGDPKSFNLQHFYPVLPREYVVDVNKNYGKNKNY